MSLIAIIIITLAIGIIPGGILLLRKSAKKFNLTPEQLLKIKQRNEMLDKEDQEEQDKK
ncbi:MULTISPECIES: DUF2897 family protein [Colwellia]|uniref:DUF2897 domain-containing protein n=1 Tax=Colwellia marinimaniae TaxID=1513592 RepID=A0ABQ0MUI9_9GAMM|nr:MULTISPECIES: DUF2897 family protein [Colwellia]GAW96021.1 DUF2897 domain-containing protein [Colwellia marinimaniae]